MRVCELKQKEVINICTCKTLGCPLALIVPVPGKMCGFIGSVSEYVSPFSCSRQIGEDIILVEIQEEKFLRKE